MHHKNTRRCFNHDYKAPAFYMVTVVAKDRRPWFAVCEKNCSTLTEDGKTVRQLWRRIPQDFIGKGVTK